MDMKVVSLTLHQMFFAENVVGVSFTSVSFRACILVWYSWKS